MTQDEANQIAGAFWASGMVLNVLLVAIVGACSRQSTPWWMFLLTGLTNAVSVMALLSFIMPRRPQWGPALRSIRLRRWS